jgi:transposase
MIYFKHSQLTNDYHVSLKTVHNWIDAAKSGKLDLQLREEKGRTYIANTSNNLIVLEKLADKGKKYRNNLHHKMIAPKSEFYEVYSRRQMLDIVSNLTIHHEIPQQYNYLDGGAVGWNDWMKRLVEDNTASILNGTIELIGGGIQTIDRLIASKKRINIIDVGVGNALPGKQLIAHLLERGLLNRYIAVDISESMLNIAEQNINEWFGGKVKFEGHVRDISYERFDDLLVDDMLGSRSEEILNLVLILGSTPANFRFPLDVLRVVYNSMGNNDLLLYTRKPDTKAARHYFDFNPDKGAPTLSPLYSFVLGLLNIDTSLYEAEMGFDEATRMRFVQVRLKSALTIKFKFDEGERNVSFEKGDTILLLRVWHQTVLELIAQFDEVGFTLLHSTLTRDREYLMTIYGVTPDSVGGN